MCVGMLVMLLCDCIGKEIRRKFIVDGCKRSVERFIICTEKTKDQIKSFNDNRKANKNKKTLLPEEIGVIEN